VKIEVVLELFQAADKYLVPKLKEETEKRLVKNLTFENLVGSAKLAIELQMKDLENEVVNLAGKDLFTLRGKEEFEQLPSSISEKILKSRK